ncbi:hypothetical protein KSX_43590 [Ktedonospora formicarum]|uniref:Uncharacterized protein n=1 Tax=Ktedonospora formicarum TaxID=2778364 RepID=A0A8J3MTR6_9CHLR|nr:hypothetical protein KSX_43590 [Ktedonospora formicarum]
MIVLPEKPNWAQRLNIRLFQPLIASNAIFGSIWGAIVATLLGMLSFFLIITIVAYTIPTDFIQSQGFKDQKTQQGREYVTGELLGYIPLSNSFRDTSELFLTAQNTHATYQTISSGSSSTSTASDTFTSPFHILLLLQGLFLILGGYLAASTDFRNTSLNSLLRGASIAIPYTALLFLLSTQVNGTIPPIFTDLSDTSSSTSTLTVDPNTLLLFGLLWGALFGLIGAGIKLGQGQLRHKIHRYLYTHRHPQIAGIITGGIASTLLGLFMALIAALGLHSQMHNASNLNYIPDVNLTPVHEGIFQGFTNFVNGLMRAVALLAYSCGAPIITHADRNNFYSLKNDSNQIWQQLGGGLITHPWAFVLLLIPIIALFVGGRISASISRVRGSGPGAIQGALIALPFTVLLIAFTLINTNSMTLSGYGSSYSSETTNAIITISRGANFGDVLLWGLVSGAITGALGGAYQNSMLRLSVSKILGSIVKPILLIFTPLYVVFDILLGRPRTQKRSTGSVLLYTAFIAALVLAVLSVGVGLMLIGQNQTITLDQSEQFRDLMALLLIGLPGILLLSAAASALAHDPVLAIITANQPQQPIQPIQPFMPAEVQTPAPQPPTMPASNEPTIQGGGA